MMARTSSGKVAQQWQTAIFGLAIGLAVHSAEAAVGTLINDAELRAKPTLDGKPGTKLKSNTQLEILSTQGAWLEVKAPDGSSGWLRLMNVRPGEKKHWSEKPAGAS